MRSLEAWMDLVAGALPWPQAQGSVVVCHEAPRLWPMLAHRQSLAWLHPQRLPYHELSAIPGGQPALRQRLSLSDAPDIIDAQLARAAGCVVVLPTQSAWVSAFASLLVRFQAGTGRPWLLAGSVDASEWAEALAPLAGLDTFDLRTDHIRWVGPASLLPRLKALLPGPRLDAQALSQLLTHYRDLPRLQVDLASPHLSLRIRPEPVEHMASVSESTVHHAVAENRALFNDRGLGSIWVPWGAETASRMLLRNVRDRINDGVSAIGSRSLPMEWVDYTDRGAILKMRLPVTEAGHPALVHLSLPRNAVPTDGFCDVGALEFIVELA